MTVREGRTNSGRDTCRKLSSFPLASARASSVLTTSYGTLATAWARSAGGRNARKGRITATDPPNSSEGSGHGVGLLSVYMRNLLRLMAVKTIRLDVKTQMS